MARVPSITTKYYVAVPFKYKGLLDSAVQMLSQEKQVALRNGRSVTAYDEALRKVGKLYGYLGSR
jgi:hypothetical protein